MLEAPGAAVSLGRSSLPRQPGAAVARSEFSLISLPLASDRCSTVNPHTSAWQDEHSGKQLSTVSTLSLSLLSIRTIVRVACPLESSARMCSSSCSLFPASVTNRLAAVRCHAAPLSSGPCFGEANQAMTSRLLEPKWLRIYNYFLIAIGLRVCESSMVNCSPHTTCFKMHHDE